MSSQPTTPVRVPKAAKTYSPATQDPDLRSQINTVLLRDGHVEKIQQTLHHTLSAHPSNWPSKISARAIELLRSGEYNSFPALIEKVVEEVRRDTEQARLRETSSGSSGMAMSMGVGLESESSAMGASTSGLVSLSGSGARANAANGISRLKGVSAVNGEVNKVARVDGGVGATDGKIDLAVPKAVIEEGVRVARECLELVCEIDG